MSLKLFEGDEIDPKGKIHSIRKKYCSTCGEVFELFHFDCCGFNQNGFTSNSFECKCKKAKEE